MSVRPVGRSALLRMEAKASRTTPVVASNRSAMARAVRHRPAIGPLGVSSPERLSKLKKVLKIRKYFVKFNTVSPSFARARVILLIYMLGDTVNLINN